MTSTTLHLVHDFLSVGELCKNRAVCKEWKAILEAGYGTQGTVQIFAHLRPTFLHLQVLHPLAQFNGLSRYPHTPWVVEDHGIPIGEAGPWQEEHLVSTFNVTNLFMNRACCCLGVGRSINANGRFALLHGFSDFDIWLHRTRDSPITVKVAVHMFNRLARHLEEEFSRSSLQSRCELTRRRTPDVRMMPRELHAIVHASPVSIFPQLLPRREVRVTYGRNLRSTFETIVTAPVREQYASFNSIMAQVVPPFMQTRTGVGVTVISYDIQAFLDNIPEAVQVRDQCDEANFWRHYEHEYTLKKKAAALVKETCCYDIDVLRELAMLYTTRADYQLYPALFSDGVVTRLKCFYSPVTVVVCNFTGEPLCVAFSEGKRVIWLGQGSPTDTCRAHAEFLTDMNTPWDYDWMTVHTEELRVQTYGFDVAFNCRFENLEAGFDFDAYLELFAANARDGGTDFWTLKRITMSTQIDLLVYPGRFPEGGTNEERLVACGRITRAASFLLIGLGHILRQSDLRPPFDLHDPVELVEEIKVRIDAIALGSGTHKKRSRRVVHTLLQIITNMRDMSPLLGETWGETLQRDADEIKRSLKTLTK